MKTIVVYKSKYGSTRAYAEWIAEDVSCEAVDAEDIKIDDLKEYFLSKDTTLENVLEEYKTKVKEALKNEKVKMGFTKADKSGYYVLNEKPEKYTVKDNKIEIVNENKITSYCELTDKNTIKINKINDNETLHEVSITFERKE